MKRARHVRLDHFHTLRVAEADEREPVDRFEIEAIAMGKLENPDIVEVNDFRETSISIFAADDDPDR